MSGEEKSDSILTDAELDEIEYRLSSSDGWVAVWQVNRIIAALRHCRREQREWSAALNVALRSNDHQALENAAVKILASAVGSLPAATPCVKNIVGTASK